MKKIIIAPDSFKGSISAQDAAAAIRRGLLAGSADPADLSVQLCPIADGGEGTLQALAGEAHRYTCPVQGTDGSRITAAYGFVGESAVIEMAAAAGLTLVAEENRCAATATTYGVGELIADAMERGFRRILLTVGGSGTNDGGCGMIAALGARFTDESGREFVPTGGTLHRICGIDVSGLHPMLSKTEFVVATDVKNPLLGKEGATYVYARQKGADEEALRRMEHGMTQYAAILQRMTGIDVASTPGCGAGGGLAAPLIAFCRHRMQSGIEAVLETVGFDAMLEGAELVITGEGKIDRQSLFGKAISGVAKAAARKDIPVVCFVGCIGDEEKTLLDMGLEEICAIAPLAPDAAYSMTHADELLERLGTAFAKRRGL